MELKILAPLWGHEHLSQLQFLDKMRLAGYDGFDMWLPNGTAERKQLYNYVQKYQLLIVAQQHQAAGNNFDEFKTSYLKNLQACAQAAPLLINSHTGRDYFSFEQNLELFDIAAGFTEKTGVAVAHETHRGRALYSPAVAAAYFKARPQLNITADLSHWVCVSESMLQNFTAILSESFLRTRHVHARIGFEQGPQVPDPRAPEWDYALQNFLTWWDKIAARHLAQKSKYLTITTEFGPQPYMPAIPFTNSPVAGQFEINCFMKDVLKKRYQA
jgi:sugar phosphate isomerase/epimerase